MLTINFITERYQTLVPNFLLNGERYDTMRLPKLFLCERGLGGRVLSIIVGMMILFYSPLFGQNTSTDSNQVLSAPEAFRLGMLALEKQNFRAAADAFRTASNLDSTNATYLHQFAKALLYAHFNNRDSVRLAYQSMTRYAELGNEASALQTQKANLLRSDIESRLEALLQDSLSIAKKQALRTNYDYSYKATAQKPPPPKKLDSSLAGQSDWRLSPHFAAGVMQQPNGLFDKWSSGGAALRWGTWFPLAPTLDCGMDVALSLHVGGLVDQASLPTAQDTASFVSRLYEADFTARFRLNPQGTPSVFGALGAVHLENTQTLGKSDSLAWRIPQPYFLIGGGLYFEPRTGEQGLMLDGRFYFVSFGGTLPLSRMITASVGYAFGSADILAEGAFADRSPTAEIRQTTLYARLALRWHIIQILVPALISSNVEKSQ